MDTQCDVVGGLSKWIDHHSDPLHSYLGNSIHIVIDIVKALI